MKKLITLALLLIGIVGWTQTTIASDGLNNSSSLFTVSGGTYSTGNTLGLNTDVPPNSPYAVEGTHAYGVTSGTATLTSTSNINTSNYSGVSISFRLASFSIGSTGNGADATDNVKVEVSPDGGTTYYSTLVVAGNTNSTWSYTAGTGNASTAYDGDTTPVNFAPTTGGARTIDGYSTVTISNIPSTATLKIRITLLNNAPSERWLVDDFKITGASVYSTQANGDWNTASTWTGNNVPPSGATCLINHAVSLSASLNNTGSITVSSTGSLQINGGGYINGNSLIYAATGSHLIMNNNSGLYGISAGQAFWPIANPPCNVTIQGSGAQINNTVGSISGILTINSQLNCSIFNALTITSSGTALINNPLNITTANGFNVNGILQLNSNGFITTNAPVYGNTSTLIYNSGGTFNRGSEWNSNSSGAGFPNNVQISTANTLLNMNGPSTAYCGGSLTIDSSTTFNNNSTVLNVANNVTINGTLNLGSDIKTAGNWTVAASGSQINNGKAVFFNGSASQTMTKTGGGSLFFDYLVVDKPAGTLYLDIAPNATDITINTTTGDVLQLVNGALDLNGREIKLQNNGGNIFTNGARTLTSSVLGAKLSINGTKYVSGSGTLSIASNIDTYLAAAIDFGSNKTTINGLLQLNSGGSVVNNAPIYSNTSLLKYYTSGTFGRTLEWSANAASATFPSTGYPNNVQISNNCTLDLGANSGSFVERAINGYLTIDNGSNLDMAGSSAMTKSLTVFGNINIGTVGGSATLTLSVNSGADLKVGGNLTFNGTYNFYPNSRAVFFIKNGTQTISAGNTLTIPYVVLAPITGSTTVQLSGTDLNITAPNGGNAIDLGTQSANNFDINGRTLTIGTVGVGNVVSGSGKFKGSTTSNLTLLGLGSIDKLNFTTGYRNLGTLRINREAATTAATLGTDVTINTAFVLTNGNLVLNASDLIISSTATSTNNGSSSFVIAQGNGQFKKFIDANGSFTFPIGETTSGLDYSPATLTYTASSYSNAFIAVNVSDAKHPNNAATTDFITRYWSVSSSGITSPIYSFSGTYTTADIVGTESNAKPGRYNGAIWTDLGASSISSNTLTLTGLTTFSSTNDFSAGGPLSFQEINLQQAEIDFATSSTFAFGNKEVGSSTDIIFTVQNLGVASLTISSTIVSGTGFSLITSPNSPVIGSTTFTIRFLPNSIGTFSGNVTIVNNDADEGTYIVNFSGTGIPSTSSDIIANSMYTYDSNIDYTIYQAATITNTSQSVNLFKFDIRDGGTTANDLDGLPTILNAITFNITNTSMIRSAALFNGNAMVNNAPTLNTGAGTIAFSGLSGSDVTAQDNSSQSLTLRVTFTSTVIDNTQFQVTINNTNATVPSDNTSSGFNAFTAVVSSTINDRNRLEVIADRLAFGQQPSNTTVNIAMTPSVTVSAIDTYSNIDLDYTNTIGITSTGALSGTTVNLIASSGVATYSTLTHTATGTGLTLTASTTRLANSNSVGSSTFNIIAVTFSNGDYKTIANGNWHSTSASGTSNTWQQYSSGDWTPISNSPPANTSNKVYINNAITLVGNNTASNIVIENGGTLSTSTVAPTWTNVLVKTGGTLNKESNGFKMNSNGVLEVEDGATFTYKHTNSTSRSTNLWFGTEKFHPDSNFKIQTSDNVVQNIFENIDDISEYVDNSNGNYAACFGNIIIDCGTGSFRLVPSGFIKNLTHGDLILRTNSDTTSLFSGNFTTTIGGNLVVENTYNNNATLLSASNTGNLTIKGRILHSAPRTLTLVNNTTGSIALTVKGNITINPTSTGTLNLLGANGGTSILNLEGDLTVGAFGLLSVASNSTKATFNFTGTGDGLTAATTQTINITSTGATRNKNIDFKDTNGAYVQLVNNNFELGSNSTFLVNSGGKLDFQTYSITLVDTTPIFTSNSGSTLITSNSNGFGGTTAGALQNFSSVGTASSAGRAVLKAGTNYIINGATSTPFPVPTSNFGNPSSVTINADTTSNMTTNLTVTSAFTVNNGSIFRLNNTGLNLSNAALTVASGGVFDNSGENQVENVAGSSSVTVNGTFITKATAGFNGTTATAISSTNNPTINLATGSTVEYAGTSQVLTPISIPNPYYNLKISGSGTKTLSPTEVLVNNNLDITASKLQIDAQKLLTVVNAINTIDDGIEIKNEGNLVQVNDGVADTGIIKMERISRAMKINDYVYWGSPVQGNVLGQMPTGFDISYMWDLDGSIDGTWNPTVATVPGRGFITRASEIGTKTFNFSNVPNNGVVTYQTNSHCDCASPNADDLTYTGNTALVANPYPSAIDAKKFLEDSANGGLGGTLFFWSSSTEYTGTVYNVDDYASWNLTGGTATSAAPASNNILSLKPSGKIAAGQGFFVQTFNDANVTFNNQMRLRTTTDNGQFYRMNNNNIAENNPISHRIWLNLTNENGDFRQALVGYVPNATNAFDKLYDGDSFTSNAIDLYSIIDARQLVIQGRALPFQVADLVPMGIKVANAGNYTIAIDELDGLFAGNQNVYLEDLNLNVIHDLKSAPYVFASESGTFNNRFVLRFTNTTLTSTDFGANNSVIVYKDKNALKFNSSTENIENVTVFDVLGRKILDANGIHNKNFSKENLLVNQQTLIVKIKLSDGTILTKKIVF